MRLLEVAMSGDTMYKGQSASPDVIPDNAFDLRIEELKGHIKDWEAIYAKLPDKSEVYASQLEYRIQNMKQELADFEEIGELPFTFYAAKDKDDAQFFSDQFEDGEVRQVKISAKNVATVEDLKTLGFAGKQTISHLTPMMVHKLKKAGFDAATGIIDRLHGDEVVVFSPGQVKII